MVFILIGIVDHVQTYFVRLWIIYGIHSDRNSKSSPNQICTWHSQCIHPTGVAKTHRMPYVASLFLQKSHSLWGSFAENNLKIRLPTHPRHPAQYILTIIDSFSVSLDSENSTSPKFSTPKHWKPAEDTKVQNAGPVEVSFYTWWDVG